MKFRFTGLEAATFAPLFALDDAALSARSIVRVTADAKPGYPCRITLVDAEPGEILLLLPFEHQPAQSPYHASGPIFVREAAATAYDSEALPPVFVGRLLSVRAYDAADLMIAADICNGSDAEPLFAQMLADESVAYLHVHNAKRGCYSARVDRA